MARTPAGRDDALGDGAPKLAGLLGLSADDTVLVSAPHQAGWMRDVARFSRQCRTVPAFSVAEPPFVDASFTLIVWDATQESPVTDLATSLRRAHSALLPHGTLVLLAANRWAPARFLAKWRGAAVPAPSRSAGGWRSLLHSAGFRSVRTFLPLPRSAEPEEFVDASAGRFELPDNEHWLPKLANRAGIYGRLHDAFLFVASPSDPDAIGALTAHLGAALAATAGGGALRLRRFDLRERGALVLLLDQAGAGGVAARVAVSPALGVQLGKNADRLEMLRRRAAGAAPVLRRLPAQLGRSFWRDLPVTLESRIEGVVGWKVAGDAARRRVMDAGARDFIVSLGAATRSTAVCDDAGFDRLVGAELRERSGVLGSYPALSDAAAHLAATVYRDLAGKTISLAFAHGDYGYGNMLVDARSGQLRGVIDWDCARPEDLLGVDWCNFLIQRHRILGRTSIGDAVRALASHPEGDVESPTADAGAPRHTTLALACLRFVLRTAQYPDELARGAVDLADAVTWLAAHNDELRRADAPSVQS